MKTILKTLPVLKWIFKQEGRQIWQVLVLSAMQVAQAVIITLMSFLLRDMVDAVSAANTMTLRAAAWKFLAASVIEIVIYFYYRFYGAIVLVNGEKCFRMKLFSTLMTRSCITVEAIPSGKWISRIVGDSRAVSMGLQSILPTLSSVISQILCILFALGVLLPKSTWILLLAIPLFIVLMTVIRKPLVYLHKEIQRADGDACGFFLERLSRLAVIRIFSQEGETVDQAEEHMRDVVSTRKKWAFFNSSCSGGVHGLLQIVCFLSVLLCCHLLSGGRITYGTLAALFSLVPRLVFPLSGAFSIIPQYYAMIGSAERLMEAEKLPADQPARTMSDAEIHRFYSDELTALGMENAGFSYPGSEGEETDRVLSGLSFRIEKNEMTVIKGQSGAGKTTVLKLLLGLYTPDGGRVYFETADGASHPLDGNFRNLFAYIPQGNGLLSGTVREALSFRKKDGYTDEALWIALHIACADGFVRALPNGLDSVLGERGHGLSEGQMQRLAIARGLVSGRPILVLDEATSALDAETEEELLAHLSELKNKTIIAVTHRPTIEKYCKNTITI